MKRAAAPLLLTLGLAIAAAAPGRQIAPAPAAPAATLAPPAPEAVKAPAPDAPLPYDTEYPFIGYAGKAQHNPVARLEERLARGEVRLTWRAPRGYLDSLLKVLDIDKSSQTLLYSKTSLQSDYIDAATPRAMYFNDDSYVAWIPGAPLIEIATMDSVLGQVFYTLDNTGKSTPPSHGGAAVKLVRENALCLQCHDTYSLLGGGVPRFIFLSTIVSVAGDTLTGGPGVETTDETPVEDRWGGWFVTGHEGHLQHRGNVLVHDPGELADPAKGRHRDIVNVDGLVDTHDYLTNKSDIVALFVLEHQVHIKDLITRVSYKSRSVLMRQLGAAPEARTWDELPPAAQKLVRPMLEALVRALLFVHAAPIDGPVSGSSGFDAWFQRQGPRDGQGRSLRELDLTTRLFRYPLSYVIYSEAFDGLPGYAQDYVYHRIADVLKGKETGADFAHLDASLRKAILEILLATKPAFARVAG
jgi:hypothetical protein